MCDSSSPPTARRREVLGALTAVAAGTGGCLGRARSITGWQSRDQVALEIKTLPADADPYALWIARSVAGWYKAAGIDARVVPMAEEELLRQVLLRNEFDVFVAPGPERMQVPNGLYPLLHSQFAVAKGWQNPFGFANLDVDDLLEAQRKTAGRERWELLAELQRTIARSQPFTIVASPDDIRAVRSNSYRNWQDVDLGSPRGYLALERADGVEANDGEVSLRMVVTDARPTENLNPLAVEHRGQGLMTGLIYDSLGYHRAGAVVPWLATDWEFSTSRDRPRATVHLREGVSWHDGEELTADDVAFTYALLADIDGGDAEEDDRDVPAPRLQGRRNLIDSVVATDDLTLEFQFADVAPSVATDGFTIPVLPKHVWKERGGRASISSIEIGSTSEAVVTDNVPPVGSGPFRFADNVPGERLVLAVVDDHFSNQPVDDDTPAGFGAPAFDRLVLQAVGSDETAVEFVASGDADLTGTSVAASTVPRIARSSDTELVVRRSQTPYVVGYNARRSELTNPRFRNTLARLVDQGFLVEDAFDGYARAAASPLVGTEWLPSDLRWEGENPITPFLGTAGELDVERARAAFRDAGYQYEDGRLVGSN